MRSEATMSSRSPRSYISRTFPDARRGSSARAVTDRRLPTGYVDTTPPALAPTSGAIIRRMLRRLLAPAVLLAAALAAPAAVAHDVQDSAAERWRSFDAHHGVGVKALAAQAAAPLTGTGENLELVANEPVARASDLELHGNLAFVGSYDEG